MQEHEDDLYYQLHRAFWTQRGRAKNRGIAFELSFDEWLNIWLSSGRLAERGKGKGRYCMSRINDEGAYEVNNVFIQTFGENIREARKREWASGAREHLRGAKACMH